jgi:uncharacterized protein
LSSARNQEIAANRERAAESLAAASALIGAGFYDDAASRAYYAVFYAATAALLEADARFKKHVGVINGVNQLFVKTGRLSTELGRDLSWLFDLRLIGDYGETRHVPEEEAREAVQTAKRLVDAFDEVAD